MISEYLFSRRLLFIAGSPDLLRIELTGNDYLAKVLHVDIPSDWPAGEYDRDAMQFFLDQLSTGGPAVTGWYNWYVIAYPTAETPATLVAGAGYFGPPDADGKLEIGYSVSEQWRRKGIAAEIVATLAKHAFVQENVKRIVAHTLPGNQPSRGVLIKNGFAEIESDDPERALFELRPDGIS